MQSLVVTVLLVLLFLLPPYLLLVGAVRMQKRLGWTKRSPLLAGIVAVSVVVAVINTVLVATNLPAIGRGELPPGWIIILASLISWVSFWGRMGLGQVFPRRHKDAKTDEKTA